MSRLIAILITASLSGCVFHPLYTINSDGTLSNNSPSSVTTGGSSPIYMTIEPKGRYIYAGNSATDAINMYSIGNDGLLTSNGLQSTGNSPRGMAFVTQ